jgi:hypothetical protein
LFSEGWKRYASCIASHGALAAIVKSLTAVTPSGDWSNSFRADADFPAMSFSKISLPLVLAASPERILSQHGRHLTENSSAEVKSLAELIVVISSTSLFGSIWSPIT